MTAAYWRGVVRLDGVLLTVWAVVTFGAVWFARALNVEVGGWPLSYWIAAQGAPLAYIGLVIWHGWSMDRLDREHDVDEQD